MLIFQEEHEHTKEEEYVGRFHGREKSGKKGTDEGEDSGQDEKGKADFFPFLHGAEASVHFLEIFFRTRKGFRRTGQEEEVNEVHQENQSQDGKETDDPVHVHEFMACQFFDVGYGHQVRRGADRRTESSDAAPPADGQKDRDSRLALGNFSFSHEMKHGHGNGTENRGDHDIGQEDGENCGCQEPDKNLVFHGRADGAEGTDGNPFVQARGGPGKADQVRPQKEDSDFREILADHMGCRNQVEKGIHHDGDESGDVNRYGPENPPYRHPYGRP